MSLLFYFTHSLFAHCSRNFSGYEDRIPSIKRDRLASDFVLRF
ncbi:hypothetical protein [Coleofasciculus sp. FACHB-1120]|nr:hypothetical protein [Coleofasciculus sp. FACHB-1120]